MQPKHGRQKMLYLRRFYNEISELSLCKPTVTVSKSVQPLLMNRAGNSRQIKPGIHSCSAAPDREKGRKTVSRANLQQSHHFFLTCRYTGTLVVLQDSELIWCVTTLLDSPSTKQLHTRVLCVPSQTPQQSWQASTCWFCSVSDYKVFITSILSYTFPNWPKQL